MVVMPAASTASPTAGKIYELLACAGCILREAVGVPGVSLPVSASMPRGTSTGSKGLQTVGAVGASWGWDAGVSSERAHRQTRGREAGSRGQGRKQSWERAVLHSDWRAGAAMRTGCMCNRWRNNLSPAGCEQGAAARPRVRLGRRALGPARGVGEGKDDGALVVQRHLLRETGDGTRAAKGKGVRKGSKQGG